MSKRWLVLDVSFLAKRAFYSMKSLEFGGVKTGVIFGVFKDVGSLCSQFGTQDIAWCFDVGPRSLRKELFPDYKKKRHSRELTKAEKRAEAEFREQMKALRLDYLPRMGLKNVFGVEGYESDDLMARIVKELPEGDSAVIVTADGDLFQCIRSNVSVYNPNKDVQMTKSMFKSLYGIPPKQWRVVKKIAGCSTDEVPGVRGIGEKTVIQYLRGELKPGAKLSAIESEEGKKIAERNKSLVVLPMKGTPPCKLRPDERPDKKGWDSVLKTLGFKSLRDTLPFQLSKPGRKTLQGFGL